MPRLRALCSEGKALMVELRETDAFWPDALLIEFRTELDRNDRLLEEWADRLGVVGLASEGKPELARSLFVRATHLAPPVSACFLLDLLLAKADRKVIPGDLEEEFGARLAKYGRRGAGLWFWGETMRTIASRNPICRWLLAGSLMRFGEWILRQIGS
jgi:hypothetical protein